MSSKIKKGDNVIYSISVYASKQASKQASKADKRTTPGPVLLVMRGGL